MMKNIFLSFLVLFTLNSYAQLALPIDFEEGQVTIENFVDFNGGAASVVANPYTNDLNPSDLVGKIVRHSTVQSGENEGAAADIWAGSYLVVDFLDFTTNTTINMRVYSSEFLVFTYYNLFHFFKINIYCSDYGAILLIIFNYFTKIIILISIHKYSIIPKTL